MYIPTISVDNLALIFSSLLVAFAVFWGILKALDLLRK